MDNSSSSQSSSSLSNSSLSTRRMSSSSSSSSSLTTASSMSSYSSSSSSEIKGTMLSFVVDGVVWNKSKFISTEMAATSSNLVGNRLAQTISINEQLYQIQSVSLLLRKRQGDSLEDFKVKIDVFESNSFGEPETLIASSYKLSSEITWTGWHIFNFTMSVKNAPASRYVSIVLSQEGGDEENYVSWFYSPGTFPGAKALYSSNNGTTWDEHLNVVRMVKISKAYSPFDSIVEKGVLQSSAATEAIVSFVNFDEQTRDGEAVYEGQHNGTITDAFSNSESHSSDDNEGVVINLPKLLTSIVVDNSGSMGWNDRGKNKQLAVSEIIDQVRSKYPNESLFDVVQFGSGGIGTPITGGNSVYSTIKLDISNPTSRTLNNDGTVPSTTDGIIACGFSNLETSHTYVIQSVKNGNNILFSGEGVLDQTLGIRIPDNVQSVGPESDFIKLNIQNQGVGSELPGATNSGSAATVAEVPASGATQIRKPSVSGRQLLTSSLTQGVLIDDNNVQLLTTAGHEYGEEIDIVDTNGVSCGHTITAVKESSINISPSAPISFGASSSVFGGFVQQTSARSPILLDLTSTLELLVKDSNATRRVQFFMQTAGGGSLVWSFFPLKEWRATVMTYIDSVADLVTYLTDDSGRPLPSRTRVQYYINGKPSWEAVDTGIKQFFDPAMTVNTPTDILHLKSVEGIKIGDTISITTSDNEILTGFSVFEIDDVNLTVRVLPPFDQDGLQIKAISFNSSKKNQPKGSRLDMLFSGVDVSPYYAGRTGGNRLGNDVITGDVNVSNANVYNQDRSRWIHKSFNVPAVQMASGDNGPSAVAAINILPITDDHLNTEKSESNRVTNAINPPSLTLDELATLNDLEYQYAQLVEDHPDQVVIIQEDSPTNVEPEDTISGDYILSPTEAAIGSITKFSSLSTGLQLNDAGNESLRFDMNLGIDTGEIGLLSKKYLVYPGVKIKNNSDLVTARYILPPLDVYFASPIQSFCNPEEGKTVDFNLCCTDTSDMGGAIVDYTRTVPGTYASSGKSIQLDYVVYNRGKYLNNAKMKVKIFDAFRSVSEMDEPWNICPHLETELGGDRSSGCKASCEKIPPTIYYSPFFQQLFFKRTRASDGTYQYASDSGIIYSEATYLDGYTAGGFQVDIVLGRASITIPPVDVVTRLIVVTEVVCSDNESISCVRYDSVWVKNPVKMAISLPSGKAGFDQAPAEAMVTATWFSTDANAYIPVPDNSEIVLSGSSHHKYNQGDGAKLDENSELGQQLQTLASAVDKLARSGNGELSLEALALKDQLQTQLDAILYKQNSWPPTPVIPSGSKTINGVASGFMIGPHGPVIMHINQSTGELVGDEESFVANGTFILPIGKGPFSVEATGVIEWTDKEEETSEKAFVKVSSWINGTMVGNSPNCFADGWSKVILVADVPLSVNYLFPGFENEDIINDLVGVNNANGIGKSIGFRSQSGGSIVEAIPGRLTNFYSTKPSDPITGDVLGEDVLDSGLSFVIGWAAAQVSRYRQLPPPSSSPCESSCCWPPCEIISVTGTIKTANGNYIPLFGCPADNVSSCELPPNPNSFSTTTSPVYPSINWMEPLSVEITTNGTPLGEHFNFVRDGITSTEIWISVSFSGKILPAIARHYNVKDVNGNPLPLPSVTLDIYYLDQAWGPEGDLIKSERFTDGTLSLSDYSPVVKICRTTTQNGHYHSCDVNDITGVGITTGTFSENSTTAIDNHIHTIDMRGFAQSPSDFLNPYLFNTQIDKDGTDHTHEPLSVAIITINPLVDQVHNICLEATVKYDASSVRVDRSVMSKTCTTLEWFDFWSLSLTAPSSALVEKDVTSENQGAIIKAELVHKKNGEYIPVNDGIRINFSLTGFEIPLNDENQETVPTFDVSDPENNILKPYANVEVTATVDIEGKTLQQKSLIAYNSTNTWSPSVTNVTNEFTKDDIYLSEAISKTSSVMGGSMLNDAIVFASDRINEWQLDNPEWKASDKIMFVLTDGCESLSQKTIDQIKSRIQMVSREGRKLYLAIMRFGSPSTNDTVLLEKIKSDNGGSIVHIPIGTDPMLIPEKVSSLFSMGMGLFNSGTYIGTIDIGGQQEITQNDETAGSQGTLEQEFIGAGVFSKACINIELPEGSSATISVRFSLNNEIWTAWSTPVSITPNMCIDLPQTPYRYMQYSVVLVGNSSFESPVLRKVTSTYLKPSSDIIFMQPIPLNRTFNEYVNEIVITHAANTPELSNITYGVAQHNTVNILDYASHTRPWFGANNRALLLTRFNETTLPIDNRTYKAINGSWPSDATVNVYFSINTRENGILMQQSANTTNPTLGTIHFASPPGNGRVLIDVIPEKTLRLAVKILNYSSAPVEIGQITAMYNQTTRVQRASDGTIIRYPTGDEIDDSSSSMSSLSSESSSSSQSR